MTQLGQMTHDSTVTLGGILTEVRFRVTQRGRNPGQQMATVVVQDKTGSLKGVVFPSEFARCGKDLQVDAVVGQRCLRASDHGEGRYKYVFQ